MDNKEDLNKPESLDGAGTASDTSQSNTSQDGASLESTESDVSSQDTVVSKSSAKQGLGGRVRGLIMHLNIYLLLLVFIIILVAGFVFIAIQRNKKSGAPTTINTQALSADELKQLTQSEQKVGDPKSTLAIESNTIFDGKVLVRDSLDVAGTIKVGGSLSLPGISVSGDSTFDQIRANNLAVTGDTTIQGQLTAQKGITSSGGATFGGPISAPSLSVQSLQLSGDLILTRHIAAGGGTPGKADGTALGAGGTASISGSDTAGTVTINTGGGPGAGCFVTVNFSQKFSGNPHVVITPVGSAAASLNYYINRNSSNFSICTANAPGAGQSFSFDYIAID